MDKHIILTILSSCILTVLGKNRVLLWLVVGVFIFYLKLFVPHSYRSRRAFSWMVPSFPNRFIPVLLCSVLFVLGQGGWKRFYMLHFPKNLPRNELTIFFFAGGGKSSKYIPLVRNCVLKSCLIIVI